MQVARYKKTGGNIVASIRCQPARDGSYTLFLWAANSNKIVREWNGNFINTDDDAYKLPKPNARHNGRLLECMAVVAVPAGAAATVVELSVTQDDKVLASDNRLIPPNSPGGLADIFIQLEQV
jgi:hypothetical protein